ncbi:unnamed protein product [Diamesa hyperborea]
MSAHNRLSLIDDFGNNSQFMILSTQSQSKLLEKKVKGKSELVILNLTVLRKFKHGKKQDTFEREIFNNLLNLENLEDTRLNLKEEENIQKIISRNDKLRETVLSKQLVIEKCLKNSTAQRTEYQMRTFFVALKKYEEFLLHVVKSKAEFQQEESKAQGEVEVLENEKAKIEAGILDVEKEIRELKQTEQDTDQEIEKYEDQFDQFKANDKELKKIKTDLESLTNKLQEKNNFAAEQENSIANININKNELINLCEELNDKKIKLQDHFQQLEIKMEELSKLMTQVTKKEEIFQLESDDKFQCYLESDEYLESKSKLESIMNDNKTLMDDLELLYKCDESSITLSNDTNHEIKLKAEALAEMEKKKQSFEDDLRVEKERYQQGMLKLREENKLNVRKRQQLVNEIERIRMEEFKSSEKFRACQVHWLQRYEEEQEKLNILKRKESSIDVSTTNVMQESVTSSSFKPTKSRTPTSSKRKFNSSSSVRSSKQMKLTTQSIASGLDEPDTDDDENDFNITFNTDTEL